MSRPNPPGVVTTSTLGWLRRLGWQFLTPLRVAALRDGVSGDVLQARLRQRLLALRFEAHGRKWPLDPDAITHVLATVAQVALRRGVQDASDTVLAMLRNGIPVEQQLRDGRTVQFTVPLLDWSDPHNNHWDIAPARDQAQTARDALPHITTLVAYVNGLPLLRLHCVERDGQGRWGSDDAATALHLQHLRNGSVPASTQLVLALDRRGGRYASPGAPAGHWVRWREHEGNAQALHTLRHATPTPKPGNHSDAPAVLRAVHAPLLAGMAAPARLLTLLHGFIAVGADGMRRIAHAPQFFAVRAGLQQLRRVDVQGRRCSGYLHLAPGTGMARTQQWLLQHLRGSAWLRHCRVLHVQLRCPLTPPTYVGDTALSPGRRLAVFMAEGRGTTLQVSPVTLHAWLRRREGEYGGDDLVLLLDAALQAGNPAWLQRARERLPRASWLWYGSSPLPAPPPGIPVFFTGTNAHAVADGLLVPVYHQHLRQPLPRINDAANADTATVRIKALVATMAQHLRDHLLHTERDLRAVLLVDDSATARRYQRAFSKEGGLRCSALLPGTAPGRGALADPHVLIATDPAALRPADPRWALLYVDRALSAPAVAQAMALLNRPHPHKHCAWLIHLYPTPPVALAAAGTDAALTLQHLTDDLPRQHRRLRALLPATGSSNFHAGLEHLGPRWAVDTHGQQRDLHRVRRRRLHQRVTGFGQQLQAAMLGLPGSGEAPLDSARQRDYRYDLHFCSLLRDAAMADAQEHHWAAPEDVRIRHWARDVAPEVREPAMEYLHLDPVQPPDPRHDADVLHSQLRFELESCTVSPQARARLRRQLHALLLKDTPPATRLKQLRALQAFRTLQIPPALRPLEGHAVPVPLQPACHAVLVRALGTPTDPAMQALHDTLADTLATAVIAARHAQPRAPHLVAADLQRRLAPVLAAQLSPRQCKAILTALPPLLASTADGDNPYGMTGGT